MVYSTENLIVVFIGFFWCNFCVEILFSSLSMKFYPQSFSKGRVTALRLGAMGGWLLRLLDRDCPQIQNISNS